jgi:hypothetical protein
VRAEMVRDKGIFFMPQGESNPCFGLERATT